MKKVLLIITALLALTSQAQEIHNDYATPYLGDVQKSEGQMYFMFNAPVLGGSVWESTISNDNPMGGLTLMDAGATSFYNGGMNGAELNERPSMASFRLTTPALSLKAGTTYSIDYRSAGTRSSNNKQLAVLLVQDGSIIANIEDGYELSPSLSFTNHHATFSVEEDGEDYTVVFMVTASAKTAGMSLMNIAIASPVPEGQGAFLGYNIIRNNEKVGYFTPEETEQGAVYLTYKHTEELAPATTYTYALQAVYEGGLSPLSNTVNYTTENPQPTKPFVPDTNKGYIFKNLDAEVSFQKDLYLNVVSTEQHQQDVFLGAEPMGFVFVPTTNGYYMTNFDHIYVGGHATSDSYMSCLVPEVWQFRVGMTFDGAEGQVLMCEKGYLAFPQAEYAEMPEVGFYATRNNTEYILTSGVWSITETELPEGIATVLRPATTAAAGIYNLQGQHMGAQTKGISIVGGKKLLK